MMIFFRFYLLFCLFINILCWQAYAQDNNSSNSNSLFATEDIPAGKSLGPLFPETNRPILEVKPIEGPGFVNKVFPGATIAFEILVLNNGNATARECWITLFSNSPFISVQSGFIDVFDLGPGESETFKAIIQVHTNTPQGVVRLDVLIEELNGYDLYPSRVMNFFVMDRPEVDLVVVDVAVRDHPGEGYIEKFDDVDLFFRIQNCSNKTFHNVGVAVELQEGTIARMVNPRLELGDMPPGESRDMQITVTTGLAARNIGVLVRMETDEKVFEEEHVFKFLTDYKSPDELVERGCDQYIPGLGQDVIEISDLAKFPNLPETSNKFAVILANRNVGTMKRLPNAYADANIFKQSLLVSLGYPEQNVHDIVELTQYDFENLFSNRRRFDRMHSSLASRVVAKELAIYYVGPAAADLESGEIYLLPSDYTPHDASKRFKLSRLYRDVADIKERYNIRSVVLYLNLSYVKTSKVGNKDHRDLQIHSMYHAHDGIITFFNAAAHHQTKSDTLKIHSAYAELLQQAMQGRADLNGNNRVSASELHRFLSDEFLGIPAISRRKNIIQVPIFWGQDRILFGVE